MFFNPKTKLSQIRYESEQRAIQGIMDILESEFGFNYIVDHGHVIEVQLIATGLALVPRQLGDLPHLYRLQLPNNRIKKLRNLDRCSALINLNIRDNKLTSETLQELHALSSLTSLDLSENHIDSLLPLSGLSKLESLTLCENQISTIPLLELPELHFLDLSGNPLKNLRNLHHLSNLIQIKAEKALLPPEEIPYLNGDIILLKQYCSRVEMETANGV